MKKLAIFFIILFLTWINTKGLWHAGFPYTHDGENHLARFANYKIALREGQFPPRFAPNLLNHYGYPVFNYNYPLANILSIPFSIMKINYELTFKILVIFFVMFGLLGFNYWLRKLESELNQPKTINSEKTAELKDKIITLVKDAEKNEGIFIDKIIMELHEPTEIINAEIKKLLENGVAYEPRPGKLRYLG